LSPAAATSVFLACTFTALAVSMAFMPKWLSANGLDPQLLGVSLALGAGARLLGGPMAGRIADALGDRKRVLRAACLLATLAVALYPVAPTPWALVLVAFLQGLCFGPIGPLSELITIRAARRHGFDYGFVRATGSFAYLVAVIATGILVDAAGTGIVAWLLLAACAAGALTARWLPDDGTPAATAAATPPGAGFLGLLRRPDIRALLVVSGLVQGSHALFYGFSAVHWLAHGHDATIVGLLWAEGVVIEILVFLLARRYAERIGTVRLALLAAAAGILRWGILAETVWLPALALSCALHGLTFGAMHLGSMRFVQEHVPAVRAATGQTLLSALGVGAWMMAASLASGPLYAAFAGHAFWAMAAMCLLAVPAALRLARCMAASGGAGDGP